MKTTNLTLEPTIFDAFNSASKLSPLSFKVSESKFPSSLIFLGFEESVFKNNLSFADASLTQLLPEIVQILYENNSALSNEALCVHLLKTNIFEIDRFSYSHFYKHKIKHFLKAVLQGLDPKTVWQADFCDSKHFTFATTSNGRQIIFHSNDFLDYLFNHTQLAVTFVDAEVTQAVTRKDVMLKLNLQIRYFD
jgi:hypothetical protein